MDGTGVALTGGSLGTAGTNYSAGKPDYVKLKLNPDKFRISGSELPGGTLGLLARASGFGGDSSKTDGGFFSAQDAEAAYDPISAMAAAADFTEKSDNGRVRSRSYVQTAGISPSTKSVAVAGNFPATGVPSGYVSGLLRAEPGSATNLTGALVDGGASTIRTSTLSTVTAID